MEVSGVSAGGPIQPFRPGDDPFGPLMKDLAMFLANPDEANLEKVLQDTQTLSNNPNISDMDKQILAAIDDEVNKYAKNAELIAQIEQELKSHPMNTELEKQLYQAEQERGDIENRIKIYEGMLG